MTRSLVHLPWREFRSRASGRVRVPQNQQRQSSYQVLGFRWFRLHDAHKHFPEIKTKTQILFDLAELSEPLCWFSALIIFPDLRSTHVSTRRLLGPQSTHCLRSNVPICSDRPSQHVKKKHSEVSTSSQQPRSSNRTPCLLWCFWGWIRCCYLILKENYQRDHEDVSSDIQVTGGCSRNSSFLTSCSLLLLLVPSFCAPPSRSC